MSSYVITEAKKIKKLVAEQEVQNQLELEEKSETSPAPPRKILKVIQNAPEQLPPTQIVTVSAGKTPPPHALDPGNNNILPLDGALEPYHHPTETSNDEN